MDGLLLDTEVLYVEARQQAARSLGREMALDFCLPWSACRPRSAPS